MINNLCQNCVHTCCFISLVHQDLYFDLFYRYIQVTINAWSAFVLWLSFSLRFVYLIILVMGLTKHLLVFRLL